MFGHKKSTDDCNKTKEHSNVTTFVCALVCVCVCVCVLFLYVCVCVCQCVCPPLRLLIASII